MKVIYNKVIPFKGFYVINLFGTLFMRDNYKNMPVNKVTLTHEGTHTEQAIDLVFGCRQLRTLGYILFYVLYFIEWLIKLILSGFTLGKIRAYRSISFEQEAYNNQKNYNYLNERKRFTWIKYVFRFVWK